MLTTYQQHAKAKLIATVVSVLVVAGIVLIADHVRTQKTSATAVTAQSTTSASPTTISSPAAAGLSSSIASSGSTASDKTNSPTGSSYSATSDYFVPHSDESIKVTLRVSNGTITDASIQNSEGDGTSARFQEDFAAEYKPYVVGKKISGLQLDTVAGASDTTQGFNDALSQIASQVHA